MSCLFWKEGFKFNIVFVLFYSGGGAADFDRNGSGGNFGGRNSYGGGNFNQDFPPTGNAGMNR